MDLLNKIQIKYKNYYKIKNEKACLIQKTYRGYRIRKKLYNPEINLDIIPLLNNYIDYNNVIKNLKNQNNMKHKKFRYSNFPSEISENIVKMVLQKKNKMSPQWDIKKGDLQYIHKILEVKAYTSDGPSSFGPTETWDYLYFIDCQDYINYNFKVYEIKLSNTNEKFYSIKVSEKETYKEQCIVGKRPRIKFHLLQKQLNKYTKLIFDGDINQLI